MIYGLSGENNDDQNEVEDENGKLILMIGCVVLIRVVMKIGEKMITSDNVCLGGCTDGKMTKAMPTGCCLVLIMLSNRRTCRRVFISMK